MGKGFFSCDICGGITYVCGCYEKRDKAQIEALKAKVSDLEAKLSASEAGAAEMRGALEAREFRLGPDGVRCLRCGKSIGQEHDPRTCEVAAALSSDAGKAFLEKLERKEKALRAIAQHHHMACSVDDGDQPCMCSCSNWAGTTAEEALDEP